MSYSTLQIVPQITNISPLKMQNLSKSPVRGQHSRKKEQTQNISNAARPRTYSGHNSAVNAQGPFHQDNNNIFSSQFILPKSGAGGQPTANTNYFNPKNRKHSDNTVSYEHTKNSQINKSSIFQTGQQVTYQDINLLSNIQQKSRKISCNLQIGGFWKKIAKKNSQNQDCPETANKPPEVHLKVSKKVKSWDEVNNFQFESNRSSSDQNHVERIKTQVQSPVLQKRGLNTRKHSDNDNVKKVPSFLTNMKFHRNSVDIVQNMPKSTWGMDHFFVVRQMGKGTFGRVIMAIEKQTHSVYAIKILSKNSIREDKMLEQLIRQLKIQMYISHPNIIKVYGFFDDILHFYIVMQCALDGQLSECMRKSPQPVPESTAALMFNQICSAVALLHSEKIIHRDLKPQNIMLHEKVVKICDFGWSVYTGGTLRSTFCGTPIYLCPEILVGDQYDESIDIWALGVILYEMLLKNNPFRITCKQELINILNQPIHYDGNAKVSETAKDLISICLAKRAIERPNIRELLLHQFLASVQNNDDKR